MRSRPPLTEVAQSRWDEFIPDGGMATDATAGNGLDTEYLAGKVGPTGHVFAVDIQQCALDATRRRLESVGRMDRVSLVLTDHAQLRHTLACNLSGQIDLICFNLGYLPTGDHAITTQRESTLVALHEALLLLNPMGALSVIAYRGHSGGMEESDSVGHFFDNLPSPWRCIEHLATGTAGNPGPIWWLASGRPA